MGLWLNLVEHGLYPPAANQSVLSAAVIAVTEFLYVFSLVHFNLNCTGIIASIEHLVLMYRYETLRHTDFKPSLFLC